MVDPFSAFCLSSSVNEWLSGLELPVSASPLANCSRSQAARRRLAEQYRLSVFDCNVYWHRKLRFHMPGSAGERFPSAWQMGT